MTDTPRLTAALADRYRIERELGAGGMATVYLADDLRHHRPVAVKVLRPELAAAIGAERFLAEIRTTANLQHPHILPLFDSGESDGFLYYVMPYVEGESLRDRLDREHQLGVAEAIRIATEVGGALDYAHRHGVIHRDVKPENILIHDGRALVADFGIALAAHSAAGPRMTETGMALGTPQYMSPEQAMGERGIGPRSDIFALGCVVYEMLLGEPPFGGPTAQAIVARVMTADVASLTAQRRTVPPALDRAVHRALERLPADRFETAAEFVSALERSVAGAPAAPAPSRTMRWLAGAGVVVVLAVVGGFLLRGRQGAASGAGEARDARQRVVAVLPFRNLSPDSGQQYFSAGITEEITGQLARVAALRVLGRAATAQYDTSADRLSRMARELGVGSVVDGSVRLAGDQVRISVELTDARTGQSLWSDQYDRRMADLFAVQDDVAHKVTAALQATLTPSEAKRVARVPTTSVAAHQLYLRALDLHPQRRSDNLIRAELLRQAIRLDTTFAAATAQLARNHMFRGVAGEPAYIDSGFVAARKAIALDSDLAEGWFALGDLQGVSLKYSDARRSYLKALELSPSLSGPAMDLANTYVMLGRYDEALDWAVRGRDLDPNHMHTPYHIGIALLPLADDSATERFLLAAERRHPTELRVQGLLAWLELRQGQNAAALARARRLVRNEPDNTEGLPILAELAVVTGAPDAEQLIQPLVAQDSATPAQMFPESLRSLLALTLHRRGDERAATALWRQAAAAATRNIDTGAEGPNAPMELAAIDAIEGRTASALDWLERGYRAGWKDWRLVELDPFFGSLREQPRYRATLSSMRQDARQMHASAAEAHPDLFGGGTGAR